LHAPVPARQPENAVEFSKFIASIRDPEVARGYEALAVESVWVGTYQHRASCVHAPNPIHINALSPRFALLF
jgi:hypothetical protein